MPAQEDYETLQGLAERLGLDEKESDSFISSSMQRLGYRPKTQWDEPEGDDSGDSKGDFFSGRRQQRQQRDVRDNRNDRGGKRASGGYGYE